MEEYLKVLFLDSIIETAWLTGSIIIVGFMLSGIKQKTILNINSSIGTKGINATGMIGVPIHELSHLIAAKIFFHKVKSIKLFQKMDDEGTLGYVNHEYDKHNPYHQIGNFWIGIAPIIGGTFVIIVMMYFMNNTMFQEYFNLFVQPVSTVNDQLVGMTIISYAKTTLKMFSAENLKDIKVIIFCLISMCVALHMSLSKADMKSSINGLICIFAGIVLLNIFKLKYELIFNIYHYNLILTEILGLSLIFAILAWMISLLLRIIWPND